MSERVDGVEGAEPIAPGDPGPEPAAASGDEKPEPAAASGDEKTVLLGPAAAEPPSPATSDSDEDTVRLAQATPDEPAPAAVGSDNGEETVLIGPAASGGAEKTVAISAAAPDRSGPAAAAQDDDATAAVIDAEPLPETSAGEPADPATRRLSAGRGGPMAGKAAERLRGWGEEHPVARRRLLVGVPSLLGLALIGKVVAAESQPERKPPHVARAVATPRPSHPVERAVVPVLPGLPVQRKPIFTLSEYRRVTGAPPFPADAIALTIDDGPHPVWTPKILKLLGRYHVPATFCMIGNQVLGHETVAGMVTRDGHQLANHTWSHPTKLAGRPRDLVRNEIQHAQAKISHVTGVTPKLFRSPGGDWSPTVLQETAAAGLVPLDWSDDPRDWSRPGVAHIKAKLLAARPGQILLCHDGGGDRSQTYAALSAVIPALTAKGLRFVAL